MALRDRLEVTMVLVRVALLALLRSKTAQEMFASYDHTRDGFLDQVEQWRMLKVGAGGARGAACARRACAREPA